MLIAIDELLYNAYGKSLAAVAEVAADHVDQLNRIYRK